MDGQLKTLNSSIFIPDPNKGTSDYATLRKAAIDFKTLGNGSPVVAHWLSLKQTVVKMLSSNVNLR
jgi:hypothetical protein